MKSHNRTLEVTTAEKQQLKNLTPILREAVDASGIREGFVGLYSQHTTAALLVSEFQDALNDDALEFLKQIVQENIPYKHNSPRYSDCDRRNAASHLRSMLLGHSVLLPVSGGKPVLGEFQSVILAELDGPRERRLQVQVLGE
jgi:secondary thiamine-phosphate synthase enzyme